MKINLLHKLENLIGTKKSEKKENNTSSTEESFNADETTEAATLQNVTASKEEVKTQFSDMDEFIDFMDSNDDGQIDEKEIKTAQEYFGDTDKVKVGDKDYNLITGNDKRKINGTNDDDLILTTDVKKINGKGGDDVIIATDAKKILGKGGQDKIYYSGDNTKIIGGSGKDDLNVTGNGNTIKGNSGWDDFHVVGDNNTIRGQNGADDFYVVGNNNKIRTGDYTFRTLVGQAAKAFASGVVDLALCIPNMILGTSGKNEIPNPLADENNANKVYVYGNNNSIKSNHQEDSIFVEGKNNSIIHTFENDNKIFNEDATVSVDENGNFIYTSDGSIFGTGDPDSSSEQERIMSTANSGGFEGWQSFINWVKWRTPNNAKDYKN